MAAPGRSHGLLPSMRIWLALGWLVALGGIWAASGWADENRPGIKPVDQGLAPCSLGNGFPTTPDATVAMGSVRSSTTRRASPVITSVRREARDR